MNARRVKWGMAAVLGAAAISGVWAFRTSETRAATFGAAAEAEVLSQTIAFFERKYAADPYNYLIGNRLVDGYMVRFQLEADLLDVERAEVIARKMIPIVPDSANAFARLSLVLLAKHGFADAFSAARTAVAADTSNAAAQAVLFDAALTIGNYDTAESALARLPRRTTTRRLRLARWLAAHGRLNQARELMLRVCRRFHRTAARRQLVAWCVTQLADIEHQRLGPGAASIWLELALTVEPGYRGAIEGLADLAYARGEWEEAESLYGEILADAHPDLYLRLAEVQRFRGRANEATRYEQRFLEIAADPDSEALYARPLAFFYADRSGSLDLAVEIMLRELDRRPSVETYDALSWIYLKRGELTLALEASDRVRSWAQPSPTADYHRARTLEALGRADEARKLYAQALADPTLLEPHARQDLRTRACPPQCAAILPSSSPSD